MELKFSLEGINEIATTFWKLNAGINVFAFHGDMGSGKTTFIHALCNIKGVIDTVSSPTFSIINEYRYIENGVQQKIFHMDLYRLKDEDEAVRAGVEDCLYSGNICLIEWPGRAPNIFPVHTCHVHIEILDEKNRKLRMDDKIS